MCGLAGILSGTLSTNEVEFFKELMVAMTVRGVDSTGVVSISRNRKQTWYQYGKKIGSALSFLGDTNLDPLFKSKKGSLRALFGHTRSATQGKVSQNNAHPFEFDKVFGVHNGTIVKKFKGRDDFETDSEALYSLINSEGIEAALNETASPSSAYALVWFDKENETINFIRNEKRPLYLAYNKLRTTLMWASEKGAIEWLAERRNISIEDREKAGPVPWMLNDDVMLSFDLNNSNPASPFKLTKIKIKPVQVQGHRVYDERFRGTSFYRNGNEYTEYGWSNEYKDFFSDLEDGLYETVFVHKEETETAPSVERDKKEKEELKNRPPFDYPVNRGQGYGGPQGWRRGERWNAQKGIYEPIPPTKTSTALIPESQIPTFLKKNIKESSTKISMSSSADIIYNHEGGVDCVQTISGTFLPKDNIEALLIQGCSWCGDSSSLEKHKKGEIKWTRANQFICASCIHDDPLALDYMTANNKSLCKIAEPDSATHKTTPEEDI